jgi:glycosyltransferase involved in cell wall biosynthesis
VTPIQGAAGDSRGEPETAGRLRVAGLHLGGSGYPNARGTLAVLRDRLGVDVLDCGRWLPEDFRLWQIGRAPAWRRAGLLGRLLAGNAISLVRVLVAHARNPAPVYVPYPSVFLLWMLSWLPRRWRPVTIADAYVSLWDSMVLDRGQADTHGLLSRALHGVESRALRAADRVLVDTAANEGFYVERLGLAVERLRSFPLAIELPPVEPVSAPAASPGGPLRVVFVGTFIPLHGLLRALEQLRPLLADDRFEFELIGDGQEAPKVQALLAGMPSARLHWIREWQSPSALAARVARADVCLGVFGGSGKAARVLPFKVYLYLAMGKPVLTQSNLSVPAGSPAPPVVGVDPAAEGELAQALLVLQRDPELRLRLGAQGAAYYTEHLGPKPLAEHWRRLLAELTSRR